MQAGFNAGDNERFLEILISNGNAPIKEIDSESESDVLGRFIFLVNSQNEMATEAQLSCLSNTTSSSDVFEDFIFSGSYTNLPRGDNVCENFDFSQPFPFFGIDYSSVFVSSASNDLSGSSYMYQYYVEFLDLYKRPLAFLGA